MDSLLATACREGNKELVVSMIEKAKLDGTIIRGSAGGTAVWNRALAYACKGGQ